MTEAEAEAEDGAGAIPPSFTIKRIDRADGVSLELYGELDLGSAPDLERELNQIDREGIGRLLIDLSGLVFMDSTGLACITRASRAAEANGHPLVLRRPTSQVRRLFELTRLTERFTFED